MSIAVSVVVPVKNEAENIAALVAEITTVLRGRESFEIVYVDDGSTDDTLARLKALKADVPELRAVRHGSNCGQSAGLRTGVAFARGDLIVTLDGDGQNDPADIPALLARYREASAGASGAPAVGLVAGQRVKRQDSLAKRFASRFANRVRRWALDDATEDTGCGLKLVPKAVFERLPYFDHMHRFLPALVQREGFAVAFVRVNHRPRRHGRSKYGVLDRALVSVSDLLGVMWLKRRAKRPSSLGEI